MSLVELFAKHQARFSPWARVLETGTDEGIEVVVVGSLDKQPAMMLTLTPDSFSVERVQNQTITPICSVQDNLTDRWVENTLMAAAALQDWSEDFPCVRFPVMVEKPLQIPGVSFVEGCYWEWMPDGKEQMFTQWIRIPDRDSVKLGQKLITRGFKRMFERVTKEVWRGYKKLRVEHEHEWHRWWFVVPEESQQIPNIH